MKTDPRRILCLCLAGVGDTLTFTPTLKRLKEKYPQCKIDVAVTFGAAKSLLECNPHINEVIHIPFFSQGKSRSLSQLLRLRRRKYDYSLSAFPSNRLEYNLVQLLTGGKRIGHSYLKSDWRSGHFLKNKVLPEDISLHVVEQNWKLLQFLDVDVKLENPGPLELYLTEANEEFARNWVAQNVGDCSLLVGIHAGTSPLKNHEKRRWAPEKFAALAQKLVREKKAVVLIFGGADETELKEKIRLLSSETRVLSVNDTSLRESAALLKLCNFAISNDSSLMHVCAAVQTPVVALFAYTFPTWVKPWQVPHRIVRRELDCSPCFYYSPAPAQCPAGRNFECNRGNEVHHAWEALEELMGEIGL